MSAISRVSVPLSLALLLAASLPAPAQAAEPSPPAATVEAESMSLPAGVGSPFGDGTASGSAGLMIWSDGTAASRLTLAAPAHLVVRARGDQCKGAPSMVVLVDGRTQAQIAVGATGWQDYPVAAPVGAGEHTVEVGFRGDYLDADCDRNLRIDRVTAQDLPVERAAADMSLTPGNGTTFADAGAPGGTGLLIWSDGTASTTLTAATSSKLVVRARGDQCAGAPTMTVAVDGQQVASLSVPSSAWQDYQVSAGVPAGAHRIDVAFRGDYRDANCDRNLRLASVSLTAATGSAPAPVAPAPAPVAPAPVAPAPVPAAAQVEAERMSLTPGAGATFTDGSASAGAGLLVWSNGTASTRLQAPAGSLTVRAKGDQCAGAPIIDVTVDGASVLRTPVSNSSWQDLTAAWPGGDRRVAVSFTNDFNGNGCDRNLLIDVLRVTTGTGAPAPVSPPVTAPAPAPQPTVVPAPLDANPFLGSRVYVDPNSNARREADARRGWDPAGSQALEKIARGSGANWYGDWIPTNTLAATVSGRIATESAAGSLPVIVAYAIPHRDCGSYSAGGAATGTAYRQWMTQLAAGIANRKVAVVLEPDALPQLQCLTTEQSAERVRLISDAVDILRAGSQTNIYLDAGGPGWHTSAEMATRLTAAGVARTRGFSLNVSNFVTSPLTTAYGDDLAQKLGGKHYVVDTSRNGAGAGDTWCNPAGRALGQGQTTVTGSRFADAFTWIKSPGESDGTCGGGPTAGYWWADYAIGLATRAA